jgi:hypothetical protein
MVAAGALGTMAIRPAWTAKGAVVWEVDDPIYSETHTED